MTTPATTPADGVPTFIGSNVRVKSMSDGKIMVTMLFDAFEPAPQYAVQPINPAAVRRATPSPGKAEADDAALHTAIDSLNGWIGANAPGGWIDDLRSDAERWRMLQERDKQ